MCSSSAKIAVTTTTDTAAQIAEAQETRQRLMIVQRTEVAHRVRSTRAEADHPHPRGWRRNASPGSDRFSDRSGYLSGYLLERWPPVRRVRPGQQVCVPYRCHPQLGPRYAKQE